MANDPPTSLRMGFGHRQARASGMGGFEEGPSTRQMNFDLEWREQEKEIRAIVEEYPAAGPVVRRMIEKQAAAKHWSVELILMELYRRGFRLPPQSK
jgi:hypothetical protein